MLVECTGYISGVYRLANTIEWLKKFLIVGFVLGLLTYISTKEFSLSFWVFVVIVVPTIAYAFFTSCKKCNNCFAVWEINKRLIDTNVSRIPFTRSVEVGRSEKHYHYVDGRTRRTHTEIQYENQDFLKEVTRRKYEHTHKCNFCGNLTTTYSTSESSQTFQD